MHLRSYTHPFKVLEITKMDIGSRKDIELLIRHFYGKVRANDFLGPIFDDIIKIDWEFHIPVIIDFWETILLDTGSYTRNAMEEHFKVNQQIKLEAYHFTTWLTLFDATVDEHFKGEKATLAKKRAHSVASLMQIKLQQINN